MPLDRHRVVRLIELAELERRLTGPERILREEESSPRGADERDHSEVGRAGGEEPSSLYSASRERTCTFRQ